MNNILSLLTLTSPVPHDTVTSRKKGRLTTHFNGKAVNIKTRKDSPWTL